MASYCSNCNTQLHMTHWRAECPSCGVNLILHGFEERFYEDAKRAELSMANARVKWKRIKANFAGSRLAKLRLFTCFVPLAALLVPMGTLEARLPFTAQSWPAGLPGLVRLFTGSAYGIPYLQAMQTDTQAGELFRYSWFLLLAATAAALCGLLVLFGSLVSVFSLKKISAAVAAFSLLGVLASICGLVLAVLLRQSAQGLGSAFFTGSIGFGAPLCCAVFLFTAAVNAKLSRKGVKAAFAEGDEERAALFTQLKKGKIQLADLPYPVVETAATRELEAKIMLELTIPRGEAKPDGGE